VKALSCTPTRLSARLKDTEAGWERASGGADTWFQDMPLPQEFPCHLHAVFSLGALQQETHR